MGNFNNSINNLRSKLNPSFAWHFANGRLSAQHTWTYFTTNTIIGSKVAGVAASVVTGPLAVPLAAAAALATVGFVELRLIIPTRFKSNRTMPQEGVFFVKKENSFLTGIYLLNLLLKYFSRISGVT